MTACRGALRGADLRWSDLGRRPGEGTGVVGAAGTFGIRLLGPVQAVIGGEPALGTWQGIYLWEHRRSPHSRTVAAHFVGE